MLDTKKVATTPCVITYKGIQQLMTLYNHGEVFGEAEDHGKAREHVLEAGMGQCMKFSVGRGRGCCCRLLAPSFGLGPQQWSPMGSHGVAPESHRGIFLQKSLHAISMLYFSAIQQD